MGLVVLEVIKQYTIRVYKDGHYITVRAKIVKSVGEHNLYNCEISHYYTTYGSTGQFTPGGNDITINAAEIHLLEYYQELNNAISKGGEIVENKAYLN